MNYSNNCKYSTGQCSILGRQVNCSQEQTHHSQALSTAPASLLPQPRPAPVLLSRLMQPLWRRVALIRPTSKHFWLKWFLPVTSSILGNCVKIIWKEFKFTSQGRSWTCFYSRNNLILHWIFFPLLLAAGSSARFWIVNRYGVKVKDTTADLVA